MTSPCPVCGAGLDVSRIDQARAALTPGQRRIFDFVWKYPGCDMEDIVRHQWADDITGGPLDAANAVSVQICLANQRMDGVSVRASKKGAGAVYFVTVE